MSESKANYKANIEALSGKVYVLHRALEGILALSEIHYKPEDYDRDDLLKLVYTIERDARTALSEVRL